jgi:tRNA-specific 2-thiouridylase
MAMSGGVDSSVAAALLLEQGYEVIGITMQIWPSELSYYAHTSVEQIEGGCCSVDAVQDARAVANKLGIPYYVLNFEAPFRETIIDYFADEYLQGRTPNPCIVCNHRLKFSKLLEKAISLDADYIATGHYVRRERDPKSTRWLLRKGLDLTKDQSYVLYGLTQRQISRSLFPLGNCTKKAIREKAAELGLTVANKADSQEICFVPDRDYARFIAEYRPGSVKPGIIRHCDGRILGEHPGIVNFTIGQRKGLGIATGIPLYVSEIDPDSNEVIVGEAVSVFSKRLIASNLNWIAIPGLKEPLAVEAKIRYTAKATPALATPLTIDQVEVIFESPQRAITPGQAVVFYRDDLMIGGGTIEHQESLE